MSGQGIDSISNYLASHRINSIFLVLKCPAAQSWGGTMNLVLKSLIDDYITKSIVNVGRIYIFGGSIGERELGVWALLIRIYLPPPCPLPAIHPDVLLQVLLPPIFKVMRTSDQMMDLDTVVDFINRLTALGNENMFEIEDKWTHEITCTESYTPQLFDWIFSHYK